MVRVIVVSTASSSSSSSMESQEQPTTENGEWCVVRNRNRDRAVLLPSTDQASVRIITFLCLIPTTKTTSTSTTTTITTTTTKKYVF